MLNINYLFQYFEKESVNIDKNEFLFQVQSHPDYPSLLSISDTLNFFQIDNGALTVSFSDVDMLPDSFLVLLNSIEKDEHPAFNYIQRRSGNYFIQNEKKIKSITNEDLQNRWRNTVFLVEKDIEEKVIKRKSFYLPLLLLNLVLLISLFSFHNNNLQKNLFSIFPISGIMLSIAAFKDLFGAKSELVNKLCNAFEFTSCDTIINSKKWNLFKYIHFSDLSIVFFMYQAFSFFMSIVTNNLSSFMLIQNYLILFSIPLIVCSLYFQKVIEKKWCPLCLAIVSILLFELVYFYPLINFTLVPSLYSIVLNLFVLSFITIIWKTIKKMLVSLKELKEYQFKINRFVRNYKLFKNNLLNQNRYQLPKTPLIFGNEESNVVITIITSPVCGFCKQAHELLQKLLNEHGERIQLRLIINSDIDVEDDQKKLFYRSFIDIYQKQGKDKFLEAIHNWFENKNIETWLKSYGMQNSNTMGIDAVYYNYERWIKENSMNFTPLFFINGYKYPDDIYERDVLQYFIYDLLDDDI